MVSIGQTLWAINKNTGIEEAVEVVQVLDSHFTVKYKGKTGTYPLSDLETRFFQKPQKQGKRSCDNCFLRFSERCTQLSNTPCEDYKSSTHIAKEEVENWPEYGDATALKLRDRKHFCE